MPAESSRQCRKRSRRWGRRHPGLAAVALALARVLDNPKAVSTQPAAARVLITTLDRLHSSLTQPRGRLAAVRALTGEVLGKPQGA